MRTKAIFIIAAFTLCACQSNYGAQPPSQQYVWDNASQRLEGLAKQCHDAYEAKQIKTYYGANECKITAMEQTIVPLFLNPGAFTDYKTQRLLLALKVDKGEIDKQEAKLIQENLYSKLLAGQQAIVDQTRAQNQAQQSAAQSAAMGAFLGSVQSTLKQNKPQSYVPPVKTQCSSLDGIVTCYTDR